VFAIHADIYSQVTYESKHHGDDPLTAPSPHVPECLSLCTPRVCEAGQSMKIPPHLHGPPSTIHIHARPGIDAEPSALSLYTKTSSCLDMLRADSVVGKDMRRDTRGKRNASYSRVGCICSVSYTIFTLFIHLLVTNQHKSGINRVQVTF
jgi:hypothetical protein